MRAVTKHFPRRSPVWLITGVVLACLTRRAPAKEPATQGIEAGVDVLTRYVWRGQLLTADPVVQPSLTFSWNGLSFTAWGSMDTTDINEESGEEWRIQEIDWTLRYAFSPVKWLDAEAGFITYTFPGTGVYTTEEVYGSATLTGVPLSPTLAVYYDVDEVNGFYINLGVSHTLSLGERLALILGATIGWGDADYDDAFFDRDYSSVGDVAVCAVLEYRITDDASLALKGMYSAFPDADIREAADAGYGDASNLVTGIGFVWKF